MHHPRPVTRYWAETHPEPFKRGFGEFTAYYGMLLDCLNIAYVDGFVYHQPQPIADEQFPQRLRRAEAVFRDKLWREQLTEWDHTFKPASIVVHRELQAVDPDALSDDELGDYLVRCRDRRERWSSSTCAHTGATMIPTGDLLARTRRGWTGLPASDLVGMLRGSAPVSAGASGELERLTALAADGAAQALLASDDDPGEVLAALRALPGDAGAAMTAYLDLVGYRLLDGFDIDGRYALELPDALLRAIRIAVTPAHDDGPDAEEREAEVRRQVPEHRPQFDELLAEAPTHLPAPVTRVFSDIWAAGIMRRAALAAGRRLAARGRMGDPEHVVDAGLDEMRAMLARAGEPTAEELERRFRHRTTRTAKDAPQVFGPPPAPPPDPSGLHSDRARDAGRGHRDERDVRQLPAPHEEDKLRGLAASGGVYEGPARRIAGPVEFDRIDKGDVLVTESTTGAFNILLPLLGAIVTDSGGLLSHSAIVAREYGIPGVVGTRDRTQRIPDGATVRVDGDAGEVTVKA